MATSTTKDVFGRGRCIKNAVRLAANLSRSDFNKEFRIIYYSIKITRVVVSLLGGNEGPALYLAACFSTLKVDFDCF